MSLLRQVEVAIGNGHTTPHASREAGITQQTFYRWRKEYSGLKLEQAKRLKELEKENAKLKRLVANLSLEKQILPDVPVASSMTAAVRVKRSSRFACEAGGPSGLPASRMCGEPGL